MASSKTTAAPLAALGCLSRWMFRCDGLVFRFGITYINLTDIWRHPKNSAMWWIARMNTASKVSV